MGTNNTKNDSKDEPEFIVEKYDGVLKLYELESNGDTGNLVKDVWEKFHEKYPNGNLTKKEFVRDNIEMKGGTEEFWESVYELLDSDSSGEIDFREYLLFILLSKNKNTKKTLETIFGLLDSDGNGVLDENEIKMFFGVLINQYESTFFKLLKMPKFEDRKKKLEGCAKRIFIEMDENKDGKIQKDEFTRYMMKSSEFRKIFINSFDQTKLLFREKEILVDDSFSGYRSKTKCLKDQNKLLKPFDTDEFKFFEEYVTQELDEKDKELFPKYYGRDYIKTTESPTTPTTKKQKQSFSMHYVAIEDLTNGMKNPCILKLSRLLGKKKYKGSYSVKSWRTSENRFHKVTYKEISEDMLSVFLYDGEDWYFKKCNKLIDILEKLKKFIITQKDKYIWDKASVLMLFDANVDNDEVLVKLVDFEGMKPKAKEEEKYKFWGHDVLVNEITKSQEYIKKIKTEYVIII